MTQLVELQRSLPDFERAGVAVFAISYDPASVLADFANKHDITYPLLTDEGSHVIRALGLLNEHIAEQHGYYGRPKRNYHQGTPYPGIFVLDEHGVIVEKQFEQSYRVRPAAAPLVELSFGGESTLPSVMAQASTGEIQVAARISTSTYYTYQKLRLHLTIQIAPGLHVYGRPVPDGYTALTVEIDPFKSLEVGPLELPEPHPFRIEGLDENFLVHEGTIRGVLTLVLVEDLSNLARLEQTHMAAKDQGQPREDVVIATRFRYQACSNQECYPPREVTLQLPLAGLEHDWSNVPPGPDVSALA